ncbi:extracellular solute-binding protein [Devosia sp. ZB163]|uniref:extracellular solute-binding protein n=1 Tax=Devosia sp. ZB163 TaxID=3025938 RepID=UPI002362F87D|nr:extracellular solute-binding protein [Devosia sp. ZB163]MDC9823712.1 extracellular solute-binding protein [Devosia sp. ZB163]
MHLAKFASLAFAALVALSPAIAQDKVWHHGGSLIGEPKYPEGFKQFDYVNPDAPVGGMVRLSDMGGFDTFNPILPEGEVATGLGLVYETLTSPSLDETSTAYGNLAEAFSYPDDYSSVTFRMNPRAKWADGEPVTAEDAVWSFNKAIELSPNQANYYANVKSAEVTAPGEVTFTFDQTGNRELPQIMGQLLVLPQHWWEGTGPDGKPRDIGRSTLEPPLGSGPYKLGSFSAGRSINYERDPNYWGLTEPFNIGQNNFQTIRYEFFRDTTAQFEGFKGDEFDWWDENLALRWQNDYNFPAVQEGRVIKETFENPYRSSGVMVGFVPNLRKPMFQSQALREAMLYAFDFEELDKLRFFGQYDRINSFFYGTEFASSGLPEGEELEILNSIKDKVPASVFTTEYKNPVNGDPTKLRQSLRTANEILTKAGYTLNGNQLVDPSGQPVAFEILLNGPTIEPIAAAFQTNLKRLGMNVSIRSVDSPQYIERVQNRDFDMIYTGWSQSLSPGNEQRFFWGSASADQADSSNYAGIKDPGIDALIDKIIFADDRETLIATTRALDRVLLAHNFVTPSYTLRRARIARWDRFSHPDELPEFSIGFPTIWWWDEAKAAKTGAAKN